jgi:glycosyltransferase involved in cell wall biosynthesis
MVNTSAALKSETGGRTGGPSLSVFLPCYNEEHNVKKTVTNALSVLERITDDYEVIIVDDGSRDRTGDVAEQLAKSNHHIRVVHHGRNLGYGSALQSGFRAATKPLVFYTDGDGQFDMNELGPLLPLIEKYDIVSCYRINRQDPLIRKFNAWCWTKLVNFVFGMHIRDVDCSFKLYKRVIFDNIQMCSTGALIDAEILARAIRKGYTVVQRGVHHYPRVAGEQTGAKISVILRAFKELFKLRKQIIADEKSEAGSKI